MAGELVPLVLLPRYTTLAGKAGDFATSAVDTTPYERALVTLWRGKIIGTVGPPPPVPPPWDFGFWLECSTDQVSWYPMQPQPTPWDGTPTDGWVLVENTQKQASVELPRRWLRYRVRLLNDDNIVSCWAVGHLLKRVP